MGQVKFTLLLLTAIFATWTYAQATRRPTFTDALRAYHPFSYLPDSSNRSPDQVKATLWPNGPYDWENVCVVRMSRLFNYVGISVPGNRRGLTAYKASDGKNYAINVVQFEDWLRDIWGKPDFEIRKAAGTKFDVRQLGQRPAVISFKWPPFEGHFDLFNGERITSPSPQYFDYADSINGYYLDWGQPAAAPAPMQPQQQPAGRDPQQQQQQPVTYEDLSRVLGELTAIHKQLSVSRDRQTYDAFVRKHAEYESLVNRYNSQR